MEDQSKLETRFLESLCLIGDGQSQVAVPLLEKLVLDGQNFAALDRVLSELAWAQKAIGKTAEAAATRKQLLERFPKSSRAAEAWFETGEAAWKKSHGTLLPLPTRPRSRRPTPLRLPIRLDTSLLGHPS